MKNQKLPWKRYQIGEVFRDEPVSANRLRQFVQCDADVVGSTLKDDAEILALGVDILGKLGISTEIFVNNRELLNEILDNLKIKQKDREQVLREIDKYDKLPEKEVRKNLKRYNAEKVLDALKKGEKYFSKFESYKEIIGIMEYCKVYGFKILFAPTIIRGLSYYTGNVFEIKAKGVRETIVAGGSYNFEGVQCTGISFGLDRISSIAKFDYEKERIMVLSIEQDRKAIELAQRLRNKKNNVVLYYGKPSKALEYANSKKINKVIFVGSEEIKKKKFKVKDMKSGKEEFVKEGDL